MAKTLSVTYAGGLTREGAEPMTKRIRNIGPKEPIIRNTGPKMPRLEPSEVAAALGAEPMPVTLEEALGPITLAAVRAELVSRLQSTGGRPGLSETTRRAKIPLADQDWLDLEKMAAAISSPGCAPSAGQVASVLLRMSIKSLAAQVAAEANSPLVQELAAQAASTSTEDETDHED
jgi:hypothetical protein